MIVINIFGGSNPKWFVLHENNVPLASHPTHSEYYSAPISAGLLRLQQ
jgi:hypothetical protein